MAASTITRDAWTNDSGSPAAPNGDGTILNNSVLQSHIYARIDELMSGAGSYTTLTLGGQLNVEGFGNPGLGLSASGTGNQVLLVRNTAAGTTNSASLLLGNDGAGDAGVLKITSTSYTAAGTSPQDGLLFETARAGGISIAAAHGTAHIRFYAGGATERGRFDNSGRFSVGVPAGSAIRNQVHIYGPGQATSAIADAGAFDGTIFVADSLSAAGNGGCILFGSTTKYFAAIKALLEDSANNSTGAIVVSSRTASGNTSLTEILRITSAGQLILNDNANASNLSGLTIQQLGRDDEVLSFKSTDVAHTFTAITENDTYGHLSKYDATGGGLAIRSFAETALSASLYFEANIGTVDGTKATSSLAPIVLSSGVENGSNGRTTIGGTSNLAVIRDNATTRFVFAADGSSYEDVGTAWINYDDQDDLAVIEALEYELSREGPNPIDLEFARWMESRRQVLSRLDLVRFSDEPGGHHFVNRSKMQNLLCGTIRQLARRTIRLEARLLALEPRPETQ